MKYETLKNIKIFSIENEIGHYTDIELLEYQIDILEELDGSMYSFQKCFEENIVSYHSLLDAEDHEYLEVEFKRRRKFLMEDFMKLYYNTDETRSELYNKPTNAKSYVERQTKLIDRTTSEVEFESLNDISEIQIMKESTFLNMDDRNEDEYQDETEDNDEKEKMMGFFNEFKPASEYLVRRDSNDRQLFMEHNEVKLIHAYAMHFWILYFLRYQYLYTKNKKHIKTSYELCSEIIKYGLGKILNPSKLKINQYTLHDLNISFQRIIEHHYSLTTILTLKKSVYETLMNELNTYVNVLFFRYSQITNEVEKIPVKNINVNKFAKISKDKDEACCNLICYMNFTFLYKYLKGYLKSKKYYFSVFKEHDMSVKFENENDRKITNAIRSNCIDYLKIFFSDYKPEITYKMENMSRKFLVPSFLKICYFYTEWNSKNSNMKQIFNSYNDETNYHKPVIDYYFPVLKEKINDIYQLFCITPWDIFEPDEKEHKTIKSYMEYLDKLDKNQKVDVVELDLVTPMITNNMVLVILHLWFTEHLCYPHFLFRYVILDTAYTTYKNIPSLLKDEYHAEPFFIRRNACEYDVVYKGLYYYCAGNIFKALYIWQYIMKEKCDNKIKHLKFHSITNHVLNYYPWIYTWVDFSKNQVRLFKETKENDEMEPEKGFYETLTEDDITLEPLFNNEFERKQEEKKLEAKKNKVLTNEEFSNYLISIKEKKNE